MTTSKIARVAAPVVAAFTAAEKAQVKVGDAVLAAATKLSEADIKPFCDAIKTSLETKGFTPNSAKVTTMYIRRVLTAIIVDGVEVEPGQTLRGLYDSLPKNATGGASHARKMNKAANDSGSNDSESEESDEPGEVAIDPAEKTRDAVTALFGHCDMDLIAAVQYAAEHETLFVRWAQASMRAAALAEAEKAIVPNLGQSTPAKKTSRKKREAVTA